MSTLSQKIRSVVGDSFGAAVVEQSLEKAIKEMKERASGPETIFYDPMSMFMGREWLTKSRSNNLTYEDLRAMTKNPIIGAIIQTRINQVAAFCEPQQDAYDVGFRITSDDKSAKNDTNTVNQITQWVYTGGLPGYGEDNLETFARKYMRDSLTLDQGAAEIVYARNKTPAYFVAVDSATIRKLPAALNQNTPGNSNVPIYVQIVNDIIVTEYLPHQMMFGIRNPQTDMSYCGYGMSELELLMRVVTTIISTEKYNAGQLSQGGTQKGLLVVKGQADTSQMDSFKRDFREAIRNAANYWRPPVLQISKDAEIEWVALDRSNRDMEYGQLFDFLVKQACGVYQMEPQEINWTIGQAGAKLMGSTGTKDKITLAQKRGLKPLLSFLANQINTNLISRIDPRYRLEFVGLNVDKAEDIDLSVKEVQNFKTIDEVRTDRGLPKLPKGGDLIMNAIYTTALGLGPEEPTPADPKTPKDTKKLPAPKDPMDDVEVDD